MSKTSRSKPIEYQQMYDALEDIRAAERVVKAAQHRFGLLMQKVRSERNMSLKSLEAPLRSKSSNISAVEAGRHWTWGLSERFVMVLETQDQFKKGG